ncbi:tRNA-dihydrouridine synthase, partial [Dimargaris cristalligena]
VSVAPMVDVTDRHFNHMCSLISNRPTLYTEMLHARAVLGKREQLYQLMGPPVPDQLVVQLGGNEPEFMARAAEILENYGVRALNLNLGCPSEKVQHCKYGAVLMKDPDLVVSICRAISAVSSLPLSIKCRIGVDDLDSQDFLDDFIHQLTSRTAVRHVIIHARKALLQNIKAKKNLTVPPLNYDRAYRLKARFPDLTVDINGGIADLATVRTHLKVMDGVMLGRKIMKDPLFLHDLACDLEG